MSAFFQELLRAGVYKRSQGRITRQVTFAALAVALALGMWRLGEMLRGAKVEGHLGLSKEAISAMLHYALPGILLLLGWWIAYRLVNVPGFADFLIAVEAEMNKVSWPSRGELFRASLVVLTVMVVLAMVLFSYDAIWVRVFQFIGIRGGGAGGS